MEATTEHEEENDDKPLEEEIDLEAPLELLNSVSSRLLRGEIPTNPTRLQSLFQHLQSVIADVVEASFSKITLALDQIDEANHALLEEAGESPDTDAYLEEFEAGREQIEESLSLMQETFFSAQNIEDLGNFENDFRQAEVQLAEGLSRMETAVARVETPGMYGVHERIAGQSVEEALDAFAACLDALNSHLEDGKPEHLSYVLERLEQAKSHVEDALEHAQLQAEELAAQQAAEATEDEEEFDEEDFEDEDYQEDEEFEEEEDED